MRKVYVEWIDSAESGHGWESEPRDADDKVVTCKSIGFLAKETETHVWISTTADAVNSNWLSPVRIWKPAIRKLEDWVWVR